MQPTKPGKKRIRNAAFSDFVVERDFPRINRRRLVLNAHRIDGKPGLPGLARLAMEDVTGQPVRPPQE